MVRFQRYISNSRRNNDSGAALVTAIFVVAILLAIAMTFFVIARQEAHIAANTANAMRARLLAEGGVNVAISLLKDELVTNPTLTSIASVWRTYGEAFYNTTWANIPDFLKTDNDNDPDGEPDSIWIPVYSYIDANGDGVPDSDGPIMGRYAFYVTDEASKININVSGNPGLDGVGDYRAHRSNEGASPAEIDLRILPQIGDVLAARFAYYRYGAPQVRETGGNPITGVPPSYTDDTGFPGKANTDDNANNLFLSNDGIDNDGDGIIDERDANGLPMEGVDEPDEFRLFHSVTDNTYAHDGVDNDGDGIVDEPDEGGDRVFKTVGQAMLLWQIGEATLNAIRNFVAASSFDRAVLYAKNLKEDLKLNINLADAKTIAKTLIERRPEQFNPATIRQRVESDGVDNDGNGSVDDAGEAARSTDLYKAFEIAANIADFRDQDCARTEVPVAYTDPQTGQQIVTDSVCAGVEPIRINEIMVRPVRRVEAETMWSAVLNVPQLFQVRTLATTVDGYLRNWELPVGTWVAGQGTYWQGGYGLDLSRDGMFQDIERPTLMMTIEPSGLVPQGAYYMILDLMGPDANADRAPDPGADVEYQLQVAGLPPQGWVSTNLSSSPARGQWLVDFNRFTSATDPIPGLPVTIAIRKMKDDIAEPLPSCFNAVILSQEPDMEWVEIVNVGTKPVNLDGWELEVVGGAIGTIPPNTTIQSGDTMILAVDKNDAVPPGASADSIFGNGMNLFTGPFGLFTQANVNKVVQLDFRNKQILAEKDMILRGGLFPNDPRQDSIDSDGDGETDEAATMAVRDPPNTGYEVPDETGARIPVVGEMQVVTLYEGPAQWGRVADRITYSSDDVKDANQDANMNGIRDDLGDDPRFDFYRSLERKNPYYTGDRGRHIDRVDPTQDSNELAEDEVTGDVYRDGSYDDWDVLDLARESSPTSRFATPLQANWRVQQDSVKRGDFELTAPRVKNSELATVGELLDVPFYDPTTPKIRDQYDAVVERPVNISIPDVATILDLVATSRFDLSCGIAEAPSQFVQPQYQWLPPRAAKDVFPELANQILVRDEDPVRIAYVAGASGTWAWGADDGLEDGVYALYVFVGENETGPSDRRPVDIEVFSDRTPDDGQDFDPVNTNPLDSFGRIEGAVPRPDGVISYGIVEVRANQLKLSLTNRADTGVVNTFTRIALAPRARDYGKMNINTVEGDNPVFGNVLAALPGLLQTWDGSRLLPSSGSLDDARRRASGVVELRQRIRRIIPPLLLPPEPSYYTSIGDLLLGMSWLLDNEPPELKQTFALRGNDRQTLSREMIERFKHISDLITVRSDVFEIVCTAQVGRVVSGAYDQERRLYLLDNTFLPVAEAKVRVVYER